jgi:nitroimidazol reductase NimA-like FMN-containing flavoprotein (pyridoxamine 5'-phosphate oxidase superfamily)
MEMKAGAPGMVESLERAECLALLSTSRHCRVAYCFLGHPHIEVVNFIVDRGDLVIRMAVGARSAAIGAGGSLAVEVDRLDDETGTGWGVTVTGPVAWVSDAEEIRRLGELLWCSAEGERPHFARITAAHVFGRRISLARRASASDGDRRSM